MKFDPRIHHRRSIRLPGYDYSQAGAYFVTIVTHGRESMFGEIENGEMRLNEAGRIVWEVWNSLPARYPDIELGTAVVMPNHFHGIIHVGAVHEPPLPDGAIRELPQRVRTERRRMTLPMVVGYFKMNSAKWINALRGTEGLTVASVSRETDAPDAGLMLARVWQRNYYEHIFRDEAEHNRIHLYIEANSLCWAEDEENPGGDP